MAYDKSVSSIQRTGLQQREMNNVMLRLSFQTPIQVIENAAINGLVDKITGVSSSLCVGQTPNIGTTWNSVSINEKFVQDYYKNINSKIDEL